MLMCLSVVSSICEGEPGQSVGPPAEDCYKVSMSSVNSAHAPCCPLPSSS